MCRPVVFLIFAFVFQLFLLSCKAMDSPDSRSSSQTPSSYTYSQTSSDEMASSAEEMASSADFSADEEQALPRVSTIRHSRAPVALYLFDWQSASNLGPGESYNDRSVLPCLLGFLDTLSSFLFIMLFFVWLVFIWRYFSHEPLLWV